MSGTEAGVATPRFIDSSIFLLPERLKALTEMSVGGQEEGKERKEGTGVVRKGGEPVGVGCPGSF